MSKSNQQFLLQLPKDKLPDIWNDDLRMNVLFAPFRNRSVNAQDWDSKLHFWKNLIFDTCVYNNIYTFKLEELQKLFNTKGRSPGCLNIVVQEMIKSGELKNLEQFLQKPSKTWSSWMADTFIKKPIVWSYSKVRDSVKSPSLDGTFVLVSAITAEGDKLLSMVPEEFRNRIVSLKELLSLMNLDESKANQLKLLLHHLMCIGSLHIYEIKKDNENQSSINNTLIKFASIKGQEQISEVDISIHILEETEKNLTLLVEKFEKEVIGYIDEAKSYLCKGHRQMAKSCLRKKHEMDKRLSQKADALHNVQLLLLKLRDSNMDAQVFESYQLALSTLKKNFKDTGLSEESVDDVVTQLGTILDVHGDIQSTLAQPLSGTDEDLEDELAMLMSTHTPPTDPSSPSKPLVDSETEELKKRLEDLKLPDVPTDFITLKNKVSS